MSKHIHVLLTIFAFAFGAAPHANAALATATLDLTVGFFPVSFSGSGMGSSAGVGGSATLDPNVLSGNAVFPITPPLSGLIDSFQVAAPGGMLSLPAQNLALSFDGTTGTMGLNASAYLMMGANPLAEIPLGVVGVGGTQMFHVLTLVNGTALANPYQLGMVTVMGALNTAPHTIVGTGSDSRTANGAGTLVLVSPTNIDLGALGSLGSLAKLTVTYTPAPGTLLLLGAGIAGLVARGRR